MLVFGGNTHNDTTGNRVTTCYSASFMVYDLGKVSYILVTTNGFIWSDVTFTVKFINYDQIFFIP